MSTFGDLKTAAALRLSDPDNLVFVDAVVADIVNAAFAEVGLIAPLRFSEDITPVDDTLDYQLQATRFPDATPEIEVSRVEIWDATTSPMTALKLAQPAKDQPVRSSASGWEIWNGTLSLPRDLAEWLDPDKHLIRVRGYCPFPEATSDDDELDLSTEQKQAVLSYCWLEGLKRLLSDRDLYTQWQTKTNNTDVSPASLHSQKASAEEDWRRRSRRLAVLRG